MNIRNRLPVNPANDSFTRKDVVKDKAVALREHAQGQFYRNDKRPHSEVWAERREDALVRFAHKVIKFVQPIGYIEPMQDAMDLRALEATQCLVHKREHRMGRDCVTADLAPEWLALQANSVDCVSMYSTYTDEDGEEHEVALDAAEQMASEAIAQTLDANIEEFLRRADEQRWYSSRPKVAVAVATADGRKGVVPKANHPFKHEELKRIAQSLKGISAEEILARKARNEDPAWQKKRALEGLRALLTPAELNALRAFEPLRRFLENYGDITDTTGDAYADAEQPYVNTLECPNCMGSGEMENLEDSTLDDCVVCMGSGRVLQTLGFEGIPVAEPLEDDGPLHEAPSIAFIDRITSHMTP